MDIVLVPRFRKFLNQLADHGARGTVPAGDAASEAAAEATLSAITVCRTEVAKIEIGFEKKPKIRI